MVSYISVVSQVGNNTILGDNMKIEEASSRIPQLLKELIHLPISEVDIDSYRRGQHSNYQADLVIHSPEMTFVIEYKSKSTAETIGSAIRCLKDYRNADNKGEVLIVAVPYMGEVGKGMCEHAGISWLDLSGNALIHAPGLYVNVAGNPNKFAHRGRPRNLFSPKASRIPRLLLLDPLKVWSHQDLVEKTSLSKGYVSKVRQRLYDANLIKLNNDRTIQPADPNLLLETWSGAYDFSQHTIRKGHIAIRSSTTLLTKLIEGLTNKSIQVAATGLAAAWFYVPFAAFRLVTVYVSQMPEEDNIKRVGFRDVESGANIWLVKPNDHGVFMGSVEREGVICVSPVQTYLDLQHQPERSKEAADALREKVLQW